MMRLADPALLAGYMADRDMTGARLARNAGVTRQFVYQLLSAKRRSTSAERAASIEKALGLLPGTLFQPTGPAARELARLAA